MTITLLPRSVLVRVSLGAALALWGCSNDVPPPGDDTLGAVGVALQVAPGLKLDSASFSLTGPGMFNRTGSVDASHSSALSFTASGIPAGMGYQVTISATLSDGQTLCKGSATFSVTARATTMVSVHLLCREPSRNGSAQINGTVNICPLIDALAANPAEVTVGTSLALAAAAHDTDQVPGPLTYQWTASSGLLATPTAASTVFTCTAIGMVTVTLTVSDGDCTDVLAQTVACSPGSATPPVVKINEVESSGGIPGDWVELYNPGSTPADIAGWVFKDNDDTHGYVLPAGSSIAPGGYFLLEEAAFGFGLGAADSARLFNATGMTVVDSYSWTAHAATTYGRCPNGSGDFVTSAVITKGAANACGGGGGSGGTGGTADAGGGSGGAAADGGATDVPMALAPWPGANMVAVVDQINQFPSNLSGLRYQPADVSASQPAILWAVLNGPGTLYRLLWDGAVWTGAGGPADWAAGKVLHYPGGIGSPDTEGVTKAEFSDSAIYVAAERDNSNNGISRLSILRYDTAGADLELSATHEWNLTPDLPAVGANLGLEAITWIPDSYLVQNGFIDESTGMPYSPMAYPDHGTGVLFVGVEASGNVHGYALNHVTGAYQRVASFSSGQAGVMDLDFDRASQYLWAVCDNTCGNKAGVLEIETASSSSARGRFQLRRLFDRPSTLPDSNNEGFAVTAESECVANQKPVFWSDDSNFGAHAIRRDSIPCGHFPL